MHTLSIILCINFIIHTVHCYLNTQHLTNGCTLIICFCIYSNCIVNTETYNGSASVGEVLCVQYCAY